MKRKKNMSFTPYNYEHLHKHLPYIIWETTNVFKKQPIKITHTHHPPTPQKKTPTKVLKVLKNFLGESLILYNNWCNHIIIIWLWI